MPRDDDRPTEDAATAETKLVPDEDAAAAETKLVPDEDLAEVETRIASDAEAAAVAETKLVPDDDAAAETKLVPDDDAAAETKLVPDDDAVAETKLVPDDDVLAATVVAGADDGGPDAEEDADDEDRTQLVTRAGSSRGDGASAQSAETRLLSPDSGPAGGAAAAAGAAAQGKRRVPDTRVLDEPDKTAPPPARPGAASPTPPGQPPGPPLDPDRGLAPGTVLFGEYEIVNVLGVGGMGEVYRAKHRRLEEHRAIKVMHAELSKKKGAVEFFYREAKALLAVRHPAVVHCHDLLSDDQGRVYLIMEMIEGVPLSKKMNDGPLSPDDVAVLGARVAHGLAAAHRKGVIHRDLSPDNIVLPNGRVQEAKIIDFGIAKLLEEGEGTIVDGFKGKLSYASPEQLGFYGGKIDGRSDFYSLGLVLAAAALGRPMGMGTTVVEAVDARRSFEHLPDAIPIGLRSAIQPLLALDPDDRPKYVDRLFVVPGGSEGMTDSGPISTGGRAAPAKKPAPARTGLIAGAAAVGALVLAAGLFLALDREPASIPLPEPAPLAATAAAATTDPSDENPTDSGSAATPAAVAPAAVVPVVNEPPKPRRLSAGDRIRIIGLLSNAKLALEENRLMSPASDNAYDRYVRVLELDPDNDRARRGMRDIAARYVSLADRALDQGDTEQARTYVERARTADPDYSGLDAIASRLDR